MSWLWQCSNSVLVNGNYFSFKFCFQQNDTKPTEEQWLGYTNFVMNIS